MRIMEEVKNPQEPRKISIVQLAPWLTAATAKNKNFLLKPGDLRMIYLLVLWEYLSKYHPGGNEPLITSDEQIAIPEPELIKMVQLIFNGTCYQYFNRVFNM